MTRNFFVITICVILFVFILFINNSFYVNEEFHPVCLYYNTCTMNEWLSGILFPFVCALSFA